MRLLRAAPWIVLATLSILASSAAAQPRPLVFGVPNRQSPAFKVHLPIAAPCTSVAEAAETRTAAPSAGARRC